MSDIGDFSSWLGSDLLIEAFAALPVTLAAVLLFFHLLQWARAWHGEHADVGDAIASEIQAFTQGKVTLCLTVADALAVRRREQSAWRLLSFRWGLGHESVLLLRRELLEEDQASNDLSEVERLLGNVCAYFLNTLSLRAGIESRSLLAPDEIAIRLNRLSPREREVYFSLLTGASSAQIAQALSISERTVHSHIGRILNALNVGSRAEAIAIGLTSSFGLF